MTSEAQTSLKFGLFEIFEGRPSLFIWYSLSDEHPIYHPQAQEAREKEEATLDHKRRMLEYEEANAAQLTALRKERDVLEDELRQQVKGMMVGVFRMLLNMEL